jgi:bifunctional UDP-N-acetylglucosamine pyrophosphorylase/glucosamine-1-phosphate N-acetyltransferase
MSGLVVATSSGAPMRSARPKPIHLLCGRAMASYVLDALAGVGVRQGVVVTGVEGGRIAKRLLEDPPEFPVRFVEQKIDRGTGDAVLLGLSGFDDFDDDEDLLVVPSDLPLLRPATIESLLEVHQASGAACTVLSVEAGDEVPHERIIRDRHGRVSAVMSSRELEPGQHDTPGPREAASGVYCIRRGLLAPAIRRTTAENLAGEFRLSDVVEVLAASGHACNSALVSERHDLTPVGNRLQLAEAEAELRRRTNRHWLSLGVTMVDPDRTYIDATVRLGTDVTIFPGTMLQGRTTIGDGCELGPDVRLDRCQVGRNTRIEKATATLARVGSECVIGPFAVLQPGSEIGAGTVTGPFYAEGTSA